MDLHTEQPQLEWPAAANVRMSFNPWSLRLRNLGAHFPSLGVIPVVLKDLTPSRQADLPLGQQPLECSRETSETLVTCVLRTRKFTVR
jgi:hypothetical protein